MKRPAIFFDRDNTLIASDGYLGDPEKVSLLEGAADAVARARSLGFATIVVSNQSGVARGMFTEDDVIAVNHRMDELLLDANSSAVIDRHEFCPFHPEAAVEMYRQESDRRKPKAGMIFSAAEKLALDLSRSWLIGDAPRDIEAGRAAGCRTILVQYPDLPESPAAKEPLTIEPDYTVTSLKEALDFVTLHLNGPPTVAGRLGSSANNPQPVDRLESIADQILNELRRRNDHQHYNDFSVTKLMAGIVQVLALALALLSYLYRTDESSFYMLMLYAIFLQALTVALLIMGRQSPM